MLDVGPANPVGEDDADLAVFVDRLAASGTDEATAAAREHITRSLAEGVTPPGLRRLAEALAASLSELPPPRRPEDTTLVAAMRDTSLVVLDGFDTTAVAAAVAALLADGRRVVVTAETPTELAAVRGALPAATTARVIDHLPAVTPAELRDLRRLLVTSTPQRRARAEQQLPPLSAIPPVAEVAELCEMEAGAAAPPGIDPFVASVLGSLDETRLAALTEVARRVEQSLTGLQQLTRYEWPWRLLAELIYTKHRGTFENMQQQTAQAFAAVERARNGPVVMFTSAPAPGALDLLRRYHEFLEAGGRSRSVFRSPLQREVQPVLELATVDDRVPEIAQDVQSVIEHLELVERRERIEAGCREMGIPAPRDERELAALADALVKIAAAARSVTALRHDVLFLSPGTPLAVPDLPAAARIALAILEFSERGAASDTGDRLDALATALDGSVPDGGTRAPEFDRAVAALRSRDAAAYAEAVVALGAAVRDARDEERRTALLQRMAADSPDLAAAWEELAGTDPAALGIASFVPVGPLLSALPAADTADVVMVLGAPTLGVDRLLLTAVAPRMVAVAGPGERAEPPTLLSVLQRASALVIQGRQVAGRVVPISDAASPRASAAPIGKVGA